MVRPERSHKRFYLGVGFLRDFILFRFSINSANKGPKRIAGGDRKENKIRVFIS